MLLVQGSHFECKEQIKSIRLQNSDDKILDLEIYFPLFLVFHFYALPIHLEIKSLDTSIVFP